MALAAKADKIYVIVSDNGPVKVGITNDPKRRLKWFQSASPDKMTLAYVASVGADARAIERKAHGLLKEHRLKGEWFDTSAWRAAEAISAAIYEFTGSQETALERGFVMPLVSVSGAAKLFQVSRPTLQRALKEGNISGLKVLSGGSETWQIDTAELARLYKLRDPDAGKLTRHENENEPAIDVSNQSETSNLTGEVVRGLEGQLQAIREELAAALAVSEERRRLLDEMVKALPRPAEPERPRRGLWGRLLGR